MTDRVPALDVSDTVLEEQLALTWHCAALLLSRPHQALLSQLESIHRATHLLPDTLGGPLRATVVHLEHAPLAELEQEYLSTFDGADLDVETVTRLSAALESAACADAGTGPGLVHAELPDLTRLQCRLLAVESGWAGAVGAVTASLAHVPVSGAR